MSLKYSPVTLTVTLEEEECSISQVGHFTNSIHGQTFSSRLNAVNEVKKKKKKVYEIPPITRKTRKTVRLGVG